MNKKGEDGPEGTFPLLEISNSYFGTQGLLLFQTACEARAFALLCNTMGALSL
jgi:hypothetical protein